jgi:hypothetical protein
MKLRRFPLFSFAALLVALLLTDSGMAAAQKPQQTFGVLPLPNSGIVISHVESVASSTNCNEVFATTASQSISAIWGLNVVNTNATTYYLKFYDTATVPTAGSGTPKLVFALLQNQPLQKGYLFGLPFKNGIGYCIVGAIADADSSNSAAGISVDVAHY